MKHIKLGDILDVKRGSGLSSDYYAKYGRYKRLTLGNFDYPGGGFKENTSKDDIYYTGPFNKNLLLKYGDIITPLTEQVRGLLGETATIPADDIYILSGDAGLVVVDESRADKRFVYYLLSSPIVKKQLDATSQQTKIRHTSPNAIKECEAWVPDTIKEQRKIAKLLDTINEMILNNNAICSDLEAMAKQLYDYWFVQFDFPDENGKPYKSSGGKMVWNDELKREIPKGWTVNHIADYMEVITGKEDANFATDGGKYKFFTCSDEVSYCDEPKFEGKAVLIAGNGNFNVKYYDGKFNAYQRTYVLIPRDPKFVGLIYQSCIQSINKLTKGSAGSIIKFITKGDVENIPILNCGKDILITQFNQYISQIQHLKEENQELESLRDFLLPMLMNGQVKVGKSSEKSQFQKVAKYDTIEQEHINAAEVNLE